MLRLHGWHHTLRLRVSRRLGQRCVPRIAVALRMASLRPANWPYEALVTCEFATLRVRKCTGHAEPPSVASRKAPAAGAVRRAHTPLSRAKPPPLPCTTAPSRIVGMPRPMHGYLPGRKA